MRDTLSPSAGNASTSFDRSSDLSLAGRHHTFSPKQNSALTGREDGRRKCGGDTCLNDDSVLRAVVSPPSEEMR